MSLAWEALELAETLKRDLRDLEDRVAALEGKSNKEFEMTTNVTITTNGNYVSTVRMNGGILGSVGPGSMVSKTFGLAHNDGFPSVFEVVERPATQFEIEAALKAGALPV